MDIALANDLKFIDENLEKLLEDDDFLQIAKQAIREIEGGDSPDLAPKEEPKS